MPSFIDYTGQKIGRLTFLSYFYVGVKHKWNVVCDCGNYATYRTDYIQKMKKKGKIFECVDCHHERECPVLPNTKYGRWNVLKKVRDHNN